MSPPKAPATRAGIVLLCAGLVLTGCRDDGAHRDPPMAAPAPLPDAVVVPAAALVALPDPGWPTAQTVGGPRGTSSVTRVQVPGAPSYTAADDGLVTSWVAGFDAQVDALPLATPPPNPFQAVSAPHVTVRGGSWGEITTEASITRAGAAPSAASWTLYADTAGDRTVPSGQLLSAAGRAWVAGQVDRLAPDNPPVRTGDGELSDVRLQTDGSMVLPLTGPGPQRSLSVPPASVRRILSAVSSDVAAGLRATIPPTAAPSRPTVQPAALTLPAAPPAPDCAQLSCIALTFDDGPGQYTDQLLDELAAARAPATFFLVGRRIADRQATVARMADAGHSIGNHTWDHPDLTTLTAAQITGQLDRTDVAIAAATGYVPTLVRPPYGAVDRGVLQVLGARGEVVVGWSDDTLDWQNRDVGITTQRALALAHRGGIVLMHDIHPSTVQAVPGIITALRSAGYTLVTVDQLLGTGPPTGVLLEHQPGYPGPPAG